MKKARLLLEIVFTLLAYTTTFAQGISISGTVYDDGTEGPALGIPTNMVGNQQLYANLSFKNAYDLFGDSYTVQASVPVSPNGTYSFTNVINRSDPTIYRVFDYSVSLSITPGIVNSPRPSPILPNAIREGASDFHFQKDFGLEQGVTIASTELTNINFSFNQYPKANSITAPSQLNPGDGSTQLNVPTLTGTDPEDGVYDGISRPVTIAITGFPADSSTLLYNNKPLDVWTNYNCVPACIYYYIPNYDPAKLTILPSKGSRGTTFQYNIADAAGRWGSSNATVIMPFTLALPAYDYGDAVSSYQTSDPARHQLVSGLQMGQLIDAENSPIASFKSTGDDTDFTDDEDGIAAFAPLSVTSTTYSVTVSVLNNLDKDATLSGWIDFNNDGTFDPSERAQTTVSSSAANQNIILTWSNVIPQVTGNGGVYARFRLGLEASEVDTPNGSAISGEVEDYFIPVTGLTISATIFADANGLTDNTINGVPPGSASHYPAFYVSLYDAQNNKVAGYIYSDILQFTNLNPGTYLLELSNFNFETSTPVPFSPTTALAGEHEGSGPGSDGTPDGKITVTIGNSPLTSVFFGVNFPPISLATSLPIQLVPSGTTQIQIPTLKGWDREDTPDINNPLYDTNAIKLIIQSLPAHGILNYDGIPVTAGQHLPIPYDPTKLTVDPDGNMPVEFTYSVVDAAGLVSEPSTVKLTFRGTGSQFDFGDAPNTYQSLLTNNGPLHSIVDGLKLGTLIDAETEGKPNVNSDGDNLSDLNDEDGVVSFPVIPGGSIPQLVDNYAVSVNVTNNSSTPAYLSGWIDWNNDGTFGSNELAQATVPTGTNGSITLTWSNQTLTGIPGLTATYARFRLSTDATAVATPTGDAPDGEVEDYRIPFATELPVALTAFQGQWVEGQGNQLNWVTAWERDNDYFQIQSSSDAQSFESIGRVKGKATTETQQSYSFIDSHPLAALTYYRIKQVDLNGLFSYSPIIAVRQGVDQAVHRLVMYPNPTTDYLQLQLSNQQSIEVIKIYRATGQVALQIDKPTSLSVNVKSLPAAAYVLEIQLGNGQCLRQRFIKQ